MSAYEAHHYFYRDYLGKCNILVASLWRLAKEKTAFEIPLDALRHCQEQEHWRYNYKPFSLNDVLCNPRKYCDEISQIDRVDLSYPIIVTMVNGLYDILDGKHRLGKCIRTKATGIQAKLIPYDELKRFYAVRGPLLHGSPDSIQGRTIEVSPSPLLSGARVVFATTEFWMAVFFALHMKDDCFECGYINGKPYILENKAGLLEELRQTPRIGYVHVISSEKFFRDPMLMKQEYVCLSSANVQDTQKVDDILKELLKQNVEIISFEEKMEWIESRIKDRAAATNKRKRK